MNKQLLSIAACAAATAMTSHGSLIAHYTFDADGSDSGTSGGTAAFGSSGAVTNAVSAVGAGALELTGPTTDTAGNDGAVSANNFTWTNDIRAVAFWMQAGTGSDTLATMISLGSGAGAGNRFDIRMDGGNLRLEVQSGGSTTSVGVGDGNWYHVAVVVPIDPSIVSNVTYFVHDTTASLVAGGTFSHTRALATGTGPLRMGDSYQDTGRDFVGLLDDVRLYDSVLTQGDVEGLAQMWSPVPEPSAAILFGLGGLALLRRRRN